MRPTTTLQPIYPFIAEELRHVEVLFDQELQCDLPFVDALCDHVRRYRGKMLRPALVLLSASACGGIRREHSTLAAVLEMVHMATLVHDDVLDDADVRRNQKTVNRMTHNETAVLLGDYLISHAYHLCSSLDSQYASRTIASCTNTVCEGELLQVGHRGNWELSIDDYLTIVSRKTAALTAVACLLGAKYADADARIQNGLEAFGLDAGIAFQIVDDILDMTGDEAEMGKTLGRDLAKGKLTLPVIHYLQNVTAEQASAFRKSAEMGQLGPDLLRTLEPSTQYAFEFAAQRVHSALSALDVLSPSPASDALRGMAEFILQRRM